MIKTPTRALLLSGGGFKGAVQVPILEQLIAKNPVPYDVIIGTSVGALNGLLAAQGDVSSLWDIWRDIDGRSHFLGQDLFPTEGLFTLGPTAKLLDRLVQPKRFRSAFGCGFCIRETTDYQVKIFDERAKKADVAQYILASCAIAGLMDPVALPEGTGSDGGHLHVIPKVPDNLLTSLKSIDIVTTDAFEAPVQEKAEVKGILDAITWALQASSLATRNSDLAEYQRLAATKLITSIVVYAPKESTGHMLDASKETIQKRFAIGRKMIAKPMVLG